MKTLFGVQSLTEEYASKLDTEWKIAPLSIQDIFKKRTFAIPDDSKIESNITDFLDWLLKPYFNFYDQNIGFA